METQIKLFKITLLLLLTVFYTGCSNSNDLSLLNGEGKSKILMLKVDYTTNKFEGGQELSFPQYNKEWTVRKEYKEPGDFGSVKLFYSDTDELLFYGTIIWMGNGEIIYPEKWLRAEDFERSTDAYTIQPAAGFENILDSTQDTGDYSKVWATVQALKKTRAYVQSNSTQKIKLFLYTPGVGVGDPQYWKWILLLKQ